MSTSTTKQADRDLARAAAKATPAAALAAAACALETAGDPDAATLLWLMSARRDPQYMPDATPYTNPETLAREALAEKAAALGPDALEWLTIAGPPYPGNPELDALAVAAQAVLDARRAA